MTTAILVGIIVIVLMYHSKYWCVTAGHYLEMQPWQRLLQYFYVKNKQSYVGFVRIKRNATKRILHQDVDTTIEETNLTPCVLVQPHDSFQGDLKMIWLMSNMINGFI